MSDSLALRLAVAVLAAVGGGLVATAVVVLHSYAWGLALGVVTSLAVLAAIPGGWWRRLSFALGWCLALLLLAPERPEGDLLIQADGKGYLLLAAGVVVLVGGVVGLVDRGAEPDATDGVVSQSDAPLS